MRFPRQWQSRQPSTDGQAFRTSERCDTRAVRLEVGHIIVYNGEPWRVLEIREKPEDLWPTMYEEEYQQHLAWWAEATAARTERGIPATPKPERSTWHSRPVNVVVQAEGRPVAKERHLCTPVNWVWQVLPEHYAICRSCGELPPCRHNETERQVSKEMAVTERVLAIPAGHCLGCGEAITHRMKKIRFPGPNLWRPDLGDNSAVFHGRSREECSNGVHFYQKQWQAKGYKSPAETSKLPL